MGFEPSISNFFQSFFLCLSIFLKKKVMLWLGIIDENKSWFGILDDNNTMCRIDKQNVSCQNPCHPSLHMLKEARVVH